MSILSNKMHGADYGWKNNKYFGNSTMTLSMIYYRVDWVVWWPDDIARGLVLWQEPFVHACCAWTLVRLEKCEVPGDKWQIAKRALGQ